MRIQIIDDERAYEVDPREERDFEIAREKEVGERFAVITGGSPCFQEVLYEVAEKTPEVIVVRYIGLGEAW
ncbi:hypothetical protein [Listeria costaricensis]|uniref:hypothetical protein n=1 Tax=Listeria costaricensis TaxID=2026604 RepID=UPI000C0702A7|nr:hypothetical protein [Listeria costaricensis]